MADTSNLSNFAEWEDIHIINVKDTRVALNQTMAKRIFV